MPAFIHSFGTAVPEHRYDQDFIRDTLSGWLGGAADRRVARRVDRVFANAGIERRYSVLPDFARGTGPFLDGAEYSAPATSVRNAIYETEARRLAVRAAEDALSGEFDAAEVTHVVTVSCTGFVAPGPDVHLVRDLGLAPTVHRTHVGFMGCYGAFPGLRLAQAFCNADPTAVVLVVCVELCTLHLDPDTTLDSLLSTALFADGAAAAVVSASRPADGTGLALGPFATTLTDHDEEMAWTIGDQGFRMRLSGAIPRIVRTEAAEALGRLWRAAARGPGEMAAWAVHPGGPAVLDAVADAACLPEEALGASRSVLRDFGNMSSATVLFVLDRLLLAGGPRQGSIAAVAFGPGLTIESAVLEFV